MKSMANTMLLWVQQIVLVRDAHNVHDDALSREPIHTLTFTITLNLTLTLGNADIRELVLIRTLVPLLPICEHKFQILCK